MVPRLVAHRLPTPDQPRRIAVLTGARQVGKTTLARSLYGELHYLNLDSPGERARLAGVPAEGWGRAVGRAILDEVQKAPGLLDKIKWAYDERQIDFSVLLGSSRILLLSQVRETLAGRVFLYELWPLVAAELTVFYDGAFADRPLIARLLDAPDRLAETLAPLLDGVVGATAGAAQAAMHHLLAWGGLPALLEYPESDRQDWLSAYQATYLERDLGDIAQLRDLESFVVCHRLAALRAGRIFSYSELARDAGLPVTTVRRYLHYLDLSYQTYLLPGWSGNPGVRFLKAPKLIWFDAGVQRTLSGQMGEPRGEQVENAITSQILMTLWSLGLRFEPSYLRTSGGLEVDLVLERQESALLFEIKARRSLDRRDASTLTRAANLFGDHFRGGIVIYRGDRVLQLADKVFAVPDWILLGT